jgi:hypothetical protein
VKTSDLDRRGEELGPFTRRGSPDVQASGFVGAAAKLMTVSHLRQEYVSTRGLSSFDLLPSIATPHTGQF